MLNVGIVGGSGFTGGELLRLLLGHPKVRIHQVTSRGYAGKPIGRAHPNMRGVSDLRFVAPDTLDSCDILFLCLPHGQSATQFDSYRKLAPRIIDLSADFRLQDVDRYETYYGSPHPLPSMLPQFVYGLAEINREPLRDASYVSIGGCNATATILGLYPLFLAGVADSERTVVEVKVGSSEGGVTSSEGSHHPVRSRAVRSFKPTGHRHTAEAEQALSMNGPVRVHMSVTAVELVRGVLATAHVFLNKPLGEKEIWQLYRQTYLDEPFIRIVKERQGPYRYPEPKLLAGTNYCDIGFERDPYSERLVVMSAIDNMMKGAAGQAVQALNTMMGWDETLGLGFIGLHPV